MAGRINLKNVDWIPLAQDGIQLRILVKTVTDLHNEALALLGCDAASLGIDVRRFGTV
jgi:hypothetical protein